MVALALTRGAAVAALLSAFGALLFGAVVLPHALGKAPPDLTARLSGRVLTLARASLLAAMAAMLAWVTLQAVMLGEPRRLAEALASVPGLLVTVRFGQFALAGIVACALALVLASRPGQSWRWRLAAVLAAVAVAAHAGHLHGFAMQGAGVLMAVEALHLLAAGAWLGGLIPLAMIIAAAPPAAGEAAARRFSPLGGACVLALLLTATWQGWMLIGDGPGLVGTEFGHVALVKTALFAALVGFAWVNRTQLVPALHGAQPEAARRVLVASIALETGTGLLTVAAAIVLTGLPPAIHVQADWPFAARPSRSAGMAARAGTDPPNEPCVTSPFVLSHRRRAVPTPADPPPDRDHP